MERSAQKVRLGRFIREEQERILEEFEEFARTHTSAGDKMDVEALRDHAAGMLAAIALDMDESQSEAAQERKSKGAAPETGERAETAGEKHGTERAESGFSLEEMVSEYRALRASVLRLWADDRGTPDGTDLHDVMRFNEAIDEVLADSIPRFDAALDQARAMFLAILGHDLRTPLNAIVAASSVLAKDSGLAGRELTLAERIYNSGRRMDDLVSDLLDLTRSRLGWGVPITPVEIDLEEIARDAVEEVQAMHPTAELRLEVRGNVQGEWDRSRVGQALSNIIANAVQHGGGSTPIVVTAREEADEVVVSTHNSGNVIEPEDQALIFDPFKRIGPEGDGCPRPRSLGLGLYIANQIALAHGGSIELRSTVDEGTTFELHLPRRVPARQPASRTQASADGVSRGGHR